MYGGGMMDNIMSAMMGGSRGGMRRRKGQDVGHALPVTLEDLYNGKTVTLPREKQILCKTCKGKGINKPSANAQCQSCQGAGMKILHRQMGPMIQQMQVPCDVCSGSGTKIDPADRCPACDGKRVITEEAPLKVQVERGMSHQTQIPFPGEGNQSPNIDTPGDIVVVLQQLKHETFAREGRNLIMQKEITLAEALCGFQFVIEHLDKRKLVVRNDSGTIIKPGEKKCIKGEGMPSPKNKGQFGDLIIEFEVKFPSWLDSSAVQSLATLLPQGIADPTFDASKAEVVHVRKQPLDQLRRDLEAEDDDDDQPRGGVQCAQQ